MEPCPESHSIQWAVAQQGGCQTSTDLCVSSFLCKIAPLLRLGTSFSANGTYPSSAKGKIMLLSFQLQVPLLHGADHCCVLLPHLPLR